MDLSFLLVLAGWAGAACTVTAYGMLSAGRWTAGSRLFQGLNIGGALLLCVSATASQAWPAAAVNAIWIVIGIQTCVMMLRAGRRALTAEAPAADAEAFAEADVFADVFALPERVRESDLAPTLVMPVITQEQLEAARAQHQHGQDVARLAS
ncbi:CBU_0592 family membrane protein [Mycetocola reblochoni]|uniref:CBU-0592-like domain-containing protein n=1 Tax=Mycetocola reblochoni REB411 TaxID=1255698 RepID=A0A1R4IUM3_9MICO|nr:hypothetical protein [Mycetocola reblochoni]SJN23560.1 hypothetical protein FM119_03695 [Mycetocola reblochoni REB411]